MSARWPLFLFLFVAGPLSLAGRGAAGPKKERAPAEVLFPKAGAIVSVSEDLEGRLHVKGWPVLLVRRATEEDKRWWVQAAIEEVVAGQFTGRARVGDRRTPPGAAFVVVVLVAPSQAEANKFKPGTTLAALPAGLPRSAPVTVFRDAPGSARPAAPRVLEFAGYSWRVKAGRRLGPGPNDFSDARENVWLDTKKHLHLAITKAGGKWRCAEVVADKSRGFGEYTWVIANFERLDRQAVLGLFTYETTSREVDFELSRWGSADPAKPDAQFVVQPYTLKDSTHRFDTGRARVLTCSILWRKGLVRGRCWEGEDTGKPPLADWTYRGRHVPPPGKERARANLWLFDGKPPASGRRQEVVIRSFKFKPDSPAPTR